MSYPNQSEKDHLDIIIGPPGKERLIDSLYRCAEKHNMTMMFISHDLSVVRYLADRIAVMQYGKIVELNKTSEIFSSASEKYTKELLGAIPLADPKEEKKRQNIIMSDR